MANEILLYNPIFSFTAESFIEQMNDFDGEDVVVRLNTPGGSVFAGWGMIAKMQEHTSELKIKVDGFAASMGAVMLLFASKVEALEQSQFTLHRADSFSKDEDTLKMLKQVNADFRKAFEARLDVAKFEKIAGITLDEFFNSEEQIDVNLNAEQAKKIGLISKVIKMEASQFEALNMKFAAMAKAKPEVSGGENNNTNPQINKKMDINTFKAEHPAVYAEAVAIGEKAGKKAEVDRAGAYLAFVNADSKAVVEGIKSGDELSQTAMAEFAMKAFAKTKVVEAAADNVEAVETPVVGTPETAEAIEAKAAVDALDIALNINQKIK